MVTGAENKGRQDSYKRADNDGIVDKSHRSTFDLPLYSATLLVDGWTATDDGGYTQTAPLRPAGRRQLELHCDADTKEEYAALTERFIRATDREE